MISPSDLVIPIKRAGLWSCWLPGQLTAFSSLWTRLVTWRIHSILHFLPTCLTTFLIRRMRSVGFLKLWNFIKLHGMAPASIWQLLTSRTTFKDSKSSEPELKDLDTVLSTILFPLQSYSWNMRQMKIFRKFTGLWISREQHAPLSEESSQSKEPPVCGQTKAKFWTDCIARE